MTDPDSIRPLDVSDRQSIAIDALISGATHREAAERAGVQRTTVTAWCNHHVAFIAELNVRRCQRLEATGEQMHAVIRSAFDAVAAAIGAGDVACALSLIRTVGVEHLLQAATPGFPDPLRVRSQLAAAIRDDLLADSCVPEMFEDMVERRSHAASGLA